MVLQRIFGASARQLNPAPVAPLEDIQIRLREALAGCHGLGAHRLLCKIDSSKTADDLWALRNDLHQCIAQVHNESVAALRINDLIQIFVGWVPDAQLA